MPVMSASEESNTECLKVEAMGKLEDDSEDYEGAKQLVQVVTGIDFNDKGPESGTTT